MSVDQIRQMLINDHNLSLDEVSNIKGKSNLVNKLLELEGNDMNIKSFEIEDIDNLNTEPSISRKDSGWTKYILDQLADDEKDGIYPKSDGLRRLLEKEICSIICIDNRVVQSPNVNNGMIATIQCNVELENGEKYTALADAKQSDLDSPYNKHVTAIAETRAEGRVFRKALRLKNTATKEEMIDKKDEEENHKINKNQIMLIDQLCTNDRLNINVKKLLSLLFDDKVKSNIREYSYDEAIIINQKLSNYQTNEGIPENIRGYDVSWKD